MKPVASLTGWVVSLDLWGTLITHGDRAAVMDWRGAEFTRVLDAFGHRPPAREIQQVVTGADANALWQQCRYGTQPTTQAQLAGILAALGVTATTDMMTVLATVHTHAVLRACPQPVPGVHAALTALAATGVRVVLTSNTLSASGAVHRQVLADLDLSAYFDDVLFSGELGVAKPRPEVFATVAARAAVAPSRVVHVGDDWRTDIEGALAAGCHAIHYHPRTSTARPDVPGITHIDQLVDALHAVCRPRTALPLPEPL